MLQNIQSLLFYRTDTKVCIYSEWNNEILHALRKGLQIHLLLIYGVNWSIINWLIDLAVQLCSNWVTVSSFWLYCNHDVKLNQKFSFLNWHLYISKLFLRLCSVIVKWCLDHWCYCIFPYWRCLQVHLRCSVPYCVHGKLWVFFTVS